MSFIGKNKLSLLLIAIILISIILRFWGLNSLDIQHDAALNSVRALGWFDFLTGLGQTSPIIWFGEIPWWGWLSFHDHPTGIFAIQWLFLNVFGQSSWAVLLSSVLAGVFSTYLIYYLVKRFASQTAALLASFLFAISSYAVWIARTGYTEAVLILFIILSWLFFTLYIKEHKNKYWVYFIIFLSLTILIKYTGIFLIGVAGVYFLIWQRKVFKNKIFWLTNLLFPFILSPVIIYNIMVWRTRGHFDAALSSMLGMHPEDYSILLRGVDPNFFGNVKSYFIIFSHNVSPPFFIVIILSILWLIYKVYKNKQDKFKIVLLLNILMLIFMFSFVGPASRFLTISLPFLIVAMAMFIRDIWQKLFYNKLLKIFFIILLMVIFSFEIFYSLNTNIFYRPVGSSGLAYSQSRFPNGGFNELDKYLRDNVYGELADRRSTNVLNEIISLDLVGREVILFDHRTDWFSQMWYIYRYQMYYDVPLVLLSDVVNEVNNTGGNIFEHLINAGAIGFWLVIGQDASLVKGDTYYKNEDYNNLVKNMVEELENSGIHPVKEINNNYNQPLFKIYHFYLN